MRILGESVAEAQSLHDAEAQTIRKRPRPVRVLEKERPRVVEAVGVGPFDPAGSGRIDCFEEWTEQVSKPSSFHECRRLIENVVGGDEASFAASRFAQGFAYVMLKGFHTRSDVDKFRHALLQIPESELPPLPEGEYYRFQLRGLTVLNRDGDVLGTLDEIIETGANDVYRVHPAEGADVLLPALADVIVSVDLAARTMVVDPPDWR